MMNEGLNMKFVLAPDSFKESMTAKEVADAMERGIRKVMPDAECIKVPMADGVKAPPNLLLMQPMEGSTRQK